MTAAALSPAAEESDLSERVMQYYTALEQASGEMLAAAQRGDWERVTRIEGACTVLIAQLREATRHHELGKDAQRSKIKIMQRILRNDAEVRRLAEPWLDDLDAVLSGRTRTLH
ncbi:MAG TPA: flagellar protein FliT [Burkholderiaceae bacterium]|nr:flagellar protein FliT [Burkholderiaceae bacterium]